MATRALIVGKTQDGIIRYGQTHWDGYRNTEWLKKHMNEVNEVEKFLRYMTHKCGNGGEGHGISSLSYESSGSGLSQIYDMNKPKINWYEDGYNCGVTNSWNFSYDDLKLKFDWPEFISYWDGSDWHDFEIDGKTYGDFFEMICQK